MATDSLRYQEATEVSDTFHLAMMVLGADAMLSVWGQFLDGARTDAQVQASLTKFIAKAAKYIGRSRSQARDIAHAYYRLHRALITGYTVKQGNAETVQLNELRRDFEDIVQRYAPEALNQAVAQRVRDQAISTAKINRATTSAENAHDRPVDIPEPVVVPYHAASWVDEQDIIQEQIDALEKALADASAADEIENSLWVSKLKMEADLRKLQQKQRWDQYTKEDQDAQKELARQKAARQAAATAQRLTSNGGRDFTQTLSEGDHRVLGWARVSLDGDACYFCLMLISRGFVYKSEGNAGQPYHDNCDCGAEPVYSRDDYDNDSRFDLNRQLEDLWQEVTEGHSGQNAINAWRRFWREHPTTAGQVSA